MKRQGAHNFLYLEQIVGYPDFLHLLLDLLYLCFDHSSVV